MLDKSHFWRQNRPLLEYCRRLCRPLSLTLVVVTMFLPHFRLEWLVLSATTTTTTTTITTESSEAANFLIHFLVLLLLPPSLLLRKLSSSTKPRFSQTLPFVRILPPNGQQ